MLFKCSNIVLIYYFNNIFMLIVKHRINSIMKLKDFNVNFGVEFDVGSYNKKIIDYVFF